MLVICKVSNAAVGKLGPLRLMHHIDTGVLVQLPAAHYDFCATQHNTTQRNMTSVSTGGLGWSENFPLLPKPRSFFRSLLFCLSWK